MSIQAVSYVLEGHPARDANRLVLLSLANHADENWECYPSVPRIAFEANVTERQAQRCLSEMVEAGWITRVINGAYDPRIPANRRPNLYRIQQVGRKPRPMPTKPDLGVTSATPQQDLGVTSTPSRGDICDTQIISRTVSTPCGEQVTAEVIPLFDDPPATPKPRARKPDPVMDAMLTACGMTPDEVPRSAWSLLGKTARELKEVGANEDEIRQRAEAYRRAYPQATLTPTALAKHWAALQPPKQQKPVYYRGGFFT